MAQLCHASAVVHIVEKLCHLISMFCYCVDSATKHINIVASHPSNYVGGLKEKLEFVNLYPLTSS